MSSKSSSGSKTSFGGAYGAKVKGVRLQPPIQVAGKYAEYVRDFEIYLSWVAARKLAVKSELKAREKITKANSKRKPKKPVSPLMRKAAARAAKIRKTRRRKERRKLKFLAAKTKATVAETKLVSATIRLSNERAKTTQPKVKDAAKIEARRARKRAARKAKKKASKDVKQDTAPGPSVKAATSAPSAKPSTGKAKVEAVTLPPPKVETPSPDTLGIFNPSLVTAYTEAVKAKDPKVVNDGRPLEDIWHLWNGYRDAPVDDRKMFKKAMMSLARPAPKLGEPRFRSVVPVAFLPIDLPIRI